MRSDRRLASAQIKEGAYEKDASWWSTDSPALSQSLFFLGHGVEEGVWQRARSVATPDGTVAIEKLKKGDPVWSVMDGRLQRAEVQALTTVQPEEYLEISTSGSRLEVTPEHLMMVAQGEYRLAGLLKAGDTVYLAQEWKA